MKVVSKTSIEKTFNISRNRGANTVYGFFTGLTFHPPSSHQTTSEATSLSSLIGDNRIRSLSQIL